jgi:hypothetical protein
MIDLWWATSTIIVVGVYTSTDTIRFYPFFACMSLELEYIMDSTTTLISVGEAKEKGQTSSNLTDPP